MASTSPFAILTANGDYEIETRTGHDHLITLKGVFGGATVTMTTYNNATGGYTSVDGGAWTDEAEDRFVAPSGLMRLSVSGAGGSTAIAINILPTYTR